MFGLQTLDRPIVGGVDTSAPGGMLPAIGFGILTSMIWSPRLGAYYFAGFVPVKYLNLPSIAVAIVAALIAVIGFFRDLELHELKTAAETSTTAQTMLDDE